jgi:hypothetical protein
MAGNVFHPRALAAAAFVAVLLGCAGTRHAPRLRPGERSAQELKDSVYWIDPEAQEAGRSTVTSEDLLEFAARSRAAVTPAKPFPHKNVLVLSGGGSYGAYPAGVLVGWTASGTRPDFDVVTGVSTGSLIGAFAFLGPSEDCELQRAYTAMRNEDIYRRYRLVPSLFRESFADTEPLRRQIARLATEERVARFAAEHRKGRRFYVGTTDLDARRAIVWDMGAIAARGTPESVELFRKVLLASASIPGFFPPVRIRVAVDGRRYVERHIDGGTTSSMFFAPPKLPPGEREAPPRGWLHGSDLYMLVAGKLYPDPTPVRPRAVAIAGNAISTIVYDQTRSDLNKLFMITAVTGMNYNLSAIPAALDSPLESTNFDPAEMSRLFAAGYEWAAQGPKWRNTPPGYEPGEGAKFRSGPVLTDARGRAVPDRPVDRAPAPPAARAGE